MKKILFLFLVPFLLLGCEVYDQPSEVHLTGGKWIFTDYDIVIERSISPVSVIKNDTICINAFGEQSYVSGGVLMRQYFPLTSADRRFVRGKTTWEFDDNSYSLYVGEDPTRYLVDYPAYMRSEHTQMYISNPTNGSVTNYTFTTDAMGANYPMTLTLTSPNIVSDLLLSNGMRDKAVTVKVILKFTR